ncbi:MAG: DUF167 domain-containing protein [Planctomycetota bacterium]|jgi:uncharacterized protein (TIGR00251 family)
MIEPDGEDVLVRVKAVPGASRDEIVGTVGGRLKVRVSAPPEGGRANTAIRKLIAEAVGVRPNQVSIDSGPTSAHKTVRVAGCTLQAASDRLG